MPSAPSCDTRYAPDNQTVLKGFASGGRAFTAKMWRLKYGA